MLILAFTLIGIIVILGLIGNFINKIDKPLFDTSALVGIFSTLIFTSVGIVSLSQDYTEQHSKKII